MDDREHPAEREASPGSRSGGAARRAVPVVGLGASAGGLKALGQFFKHVPEGSGLAFVVIQHQDRRAGAELADLLQTFTRVRVCTVEDEVAVEPDCVYVLPPGRGLRLHDGRMRLEVRRGRAAKASLVDACFEALAGAFGERAVGVVLSGRGADGARGVKAIKAHGGLAMAQDPSDAVYDAMPRAAIDTGVVDVVLPAAELSQRLLALRQAPVPLPPPESETLGEADAEALRRVFTHLRLKTGHDFSYYKRTTVLRRLSRRMQANRVADLPAYLQLLRRNAEEGQALFRELLIGVTDFFRDPDAYAALDRQVVPALFAGKGEADVIRVWVAGCATGEEAYSLAMLLAEHAEALPHPPRIQLFATDIDEAALVFAREGLYPAASVAGVPPERLERFFTREAGGLRVARELRETVLFAVHNLLKDPPFSKLDLITCRNLLIYLEKDVQGRVYELFHYALQPGGYLFLGTSESAEGAGTRFAVVDKKHHLYRRQGAGNAPPRFPVVPLPGPLSREQPHRRPAPPPPAQGFEALNQRLLLARYARPSLLVDVHHQVVYVGGGAGRYLRHAEGAATQDVLKLVHEDLRLDLQTALHRAARQGEVVETRPVPVRMTGDEVEERVRLVVQPAADGERFPGFLQVVFEAAPAEPRADAHREPAPGADPARGEVEQELQRTRASLQTTIEELEHANEELRHTNAELLSVNEELQSTTEELETSQEELQSMNEELVTVNHELRAKIEELSQVNNDLQHLMEATHIATVFLDRSLRIQRYTPAATAVFNLIPADVGRPLEHVTHKVDQAYLLELARRVLEHQAPVEREVQSRDDRWYLVRLLPYRTDEDEPAGVVATFVDVTERKQAEVTLRRQQQELEVLVERAPDLVARFDSGLRHVYANPAIEHVTGIARRDFIGRTGRELGLPAALVDPLEAALRRVFDTGDEVVVELAYAAPGRGDRAFEAHLVPERADGEVATAFLLARDVTDRVEAERALHESERRYRLLMEVTSDYIFAYRVDPGRAIHVEHVSASFERIVGYRPDEVMQRDQWARFVHPDDLTAVRTALGRVYQGEPQTYEFRMVQRDGTLRRLRITARPLRDAAEGRVVRILGAGQDVTARRRVEAALQESERRYRSLFEMASISLWEEDFSAVKTLLDGLKSDGVTDIRTYLEAHPEFVTHAVGLVRVRDVNAATVRLYGAADKADLMASLERVFVYETRATFLEELIALFEGRPYFEGETIMQALDGRRIDVLVAMALPAATGAYDRVIVSLVDITVRREAEQRLRELNETLEQRVEERTQALRLSELRFATMFHAAPFPIVLTTAAEGRVLDCNAGYTEVVGYTRQELLGRTTAEVGVLDAAARERLAHLLRERSGCRNQEVQIRTANGLPLDTLCSVEVIEVGGERCFLTMFVDITERKRAEEQARRSQERFRRIFEMAPVAVSLSTIPDGLMLEVNDRFLELTGYAREEVVGRRTPELGLVVEPGREQLVALLEQEGRIRDQEVRIRRRDGALRDILVSGEVIEVGGEPCLLAMFYDITERKHLEREVLEVSDREQRRIGHDLHDDLGQRLTGIAFLAKVLLQNLEEKHDENAEQARRITQLLNETLAYARDLSRLLSPVEVYREGLRDALDLLAQNTRKLFGLACTLEAEGDLSVDDNGVATHLYRIAQEAVTNAARHARARAIHIRLTGGPRRLTLAVEDDGAGIADEAVQQSEGLGLRTMRYRADLIGAALRIERRAEGGTAVTCALPRRKPH